MNYTTVVTPDTPHTFKGFTWSYSALKNYEACPRRYNEINVTKRVKEEESEHMRWGNAVHKAFENRVRHGTTLPLGMGMHEPFMRKLANAPGQVYAEQKLGITSEFKPSTFFGKQVWYRGIVDYANVRDTGLAILVDYKTGRPATDTTQLQLNAAMIFAHDKKVDRIRAALLFVGHEEVEKAEFMREDLTEIWSGILPRVAKLVQAQKEQHYPPKPGPFCRKWCPVASCPFHGK
jgi:hypothetical protein